MAVRKKKNAQMASYGKKGQSSLREKLGEEGYKKHMIKNAKKRWAKYPEQHSAAKRARESNA